MESVEEIIISTRAAREHPYLGVLGQKIRYAAAWWRIVGICLTRTPDGLRQVHYVLQFFGPAGGRKRSLKGTP